MLNVSGGSRVPPPLPLFRWDRAAGHWTRRMNMIDAFIIAGLVAVVESAVFAVSFGVIRGVFDRTWKQWR